MRTILLDKSWNVKTTVCWGQRDRWLTFDGVEDFCKDLKQELIQIPNVPTLSSYDLHVHVDGKLQTNVMKKNRFSSILFS